MPEPISTGGSGAAAAWVLLPKIIAAVVGAVFALTLSGDITRDGHLRLNLRVLVTFTAAVSLSLSGGAFAIEHYGLGAYSTTAQGFVMFLFAVLGLLLLGVVYRSIELLRGKRLSEIVGELGAAYAAIVRGFKS